MLHLNESNDILITYCNRQTVGSNETFHDFNNSAHQFMLIYKH